jgi:hypothetical protein
MLDRHRSTARSIPRADQEETDMRHRTIAAATAGVLLAATLAAGPPAGAGGGTGGQRYDPKIRPEDFGGPIDNPYFPVRPGERWVYTGTTPNGIERTVVEVTPDTKTILGVATAVVHDTVSVAGVIIEDTFDWYAQDTRGNVWYFGEDTHEYENGVPVSSAGAWESGVGGAKPGIVMPAHPKVGDRYRQEFKAGEAEDRATVLRRRASVTVPLGTFDGVLVTKDFTPLEPDVVEHKYYAKGVGNVLETTTKGPKERTELVEHTTSGSAPTATT